MEIKEKDKSRHKEKQGRIHGTRCAFTFENSTGQTDGWTYGRTDGHDHMKRCEGASKTGEENGKISKAILGYR